MSPDTHVRVPKLPGRGNRYRHGESTSKTRTKEYRAWCHIRQRCHLKTDPGFSIYGGRGIEVCESWRYSFENFLRDVGRAPSELHSLDRIDNNGNYEPGNVRWATSHEQSRNTRRNIVVDGLALVDYCRNNNLSYTAVQARIRRGHPKEVAISSLMGSDYRRFVKERLS